MTRTLNERFLDVVNRRDEATAFLVRRGGQWREFSFRWAGDQAQRIAFGLRALGFEPGTRLGMLAENRPEWAVADFGAMAAGCALVPLYTTLISSQIEYILRNAEVRAVFVSTMEHLEAVLSIRERVPTIEKIIVFYPEGLQETDLVISLDGLTWMGDGHSRDEFARMALSVQPHDTATLIYTSGTTGNPKGVVLSHGNMIAEIEAVEPLFEGQTGDMVISFLPLSHILQRVADTFAFQFGMTIAYAQSLDTLAEDLQAVRPTHIVAVPRVYEKISARIHEGVAKGSPLRRRLFEWAIGVGRRFREAEARDAVWPALALRHAVADRLVFRKIRMATGGRMKFYVAAGAPLAAELAEFFHAVGITILEVYGMTESAGAITANLSTAFRFGTVGRECPGVEIKVADNGEVCLRGAFVMQGYWRMPEETAETIDSEGWLHTGDVGHIDDDGFLVITDRIKELIVTAGGKNVAPQPLENALKSDRFISQAMVIGDGRNFISALVVPEREVLEAWGAANGIAGDIAALCIDPRVIDHYQAIVEAQMEAFSRYEQVKKFTLVPTEFTQEAGELTPTLKLKRRVLLARYGDLIDRMYAGAARA